MSETTATSTTTTKTTDKDNVNNNNNNENKEEKQPINIIVLGMAGSGKTTLLQVSLNYISFFLYAVYIPHTNIIRIKNLLFYFF